MKKYIHVCRWGKTYILINRNVYGYTVYENIFAGNVSPMVRIYRMYYISCRGFMREEMGFNKY